MGFYIEKCVMLVIKSDERKKADGIELPNLKSRKRLVEKENYKFLGISKADIIKQGEIKENLRKEYFRRARKLL